MPDIPPQYTLIGKILSMLAVGRQVSGKLNLSRSQLLSGAIKSDVCYKCALTLDIKFVSISN